jgi:HEPN domain-containing protein
MPNRNRDWMDQAKRDLLRAHSSQNKGLHEWACFASQQTAAKAVKSLHLFRNQEAWGLVNSRLLMQLPAAVPPEIVEKARVLDSYYMPTSNANGHPEGPPFEHYGPLQSTEAIQYASEILEFCRSQMA